MTDGNSSSLVMEDDMMLGAEGIFLIYILVIKIIFFG